MKTKLFLAVIGLFTLTQTLQAVEPIKPGTFHNEVSSRYYYDEPIVFEERGIMFYVFLDGDFDFNTNPRGNVQFAYTRGKGKHLGIKISKGVRIERDYYGRISRVGNVYISYNRYDQVDRIGSVYIDYYRDRMERVGNLDIIYGRHGVRFVGSVKGRYDNDYYYSDRDWNRYNSGPSYVTIEYDFYNPFFTSGNFHRDYEDFDEDDHFFYYRSKAADGRDAKIIKRKKVETNDRTKKYDNDDRMKKVEHTVKQPSRRG